MNKKALKIILAIILFLILGCVAYISWIMLGYIQADKEYEQLTDEYVTSADMDDHYENNTEAEPEDICPVPIPDRDIDIDGLLLANPDFTGWLYYEDGGVDYPVVKEHEDDINGYLHRTFEGQKSSSGCIFIPYDASEDFTDLNTFFYGHNMRNGSMFGSLKKIFRNPSENYNNPYFYLWTKDHEILVYRVVSMYVVDKDSSMFAVPTDEKTYEEYLSAVLNAGRLDSLKPFTDFEEQAMDETAPLITFSVCYGAAGTRNRLLVHGVQIWKGNY